MVECIQIRTACEGDAEAIIDGLKMNAEHLSLCEKVTVTVEDILRHGFGPSPAFHALIAEQRGVFAGLCIFLDTFSTWTGRRGAYIQDLVVDPRFRGYGVGQQLLRHTIKQVVEKGGHYLRLSVDAQNQSAQTFYEKFGFVWCQEERIYALRGDAFLSSEGIIIGKEEE
ncbi:hypothetical protein N185_16205 [Sinorhizobium sp. GW3]|nr:hypothetical protein N185_16205 [Sinorhizobium sp. GW3]